MASFHISQDRVNWSWNANHEPAIRVQSGDVVTLEVANASGGQLSRESTVDDVACLDFSRVNPVTGPIYVHGAEPGDALRVDIMAIDLDCWGWTANIPGFGLLADQFPEPHLRISQVTDRYAEILPGVRVPTAPFIGTIGLAMAEPGDHPLVPPSAQGGNMDLRHLTAGCRLWLPVAVPGALLSVGDTHAAQGDGEVAGTAIETSSAVILQVHLEKAAHLRTPRLETRGSAYPSNACWVTSGIGPDLWEAARVATQEMVEWVARLGGLAPEDAYLLTSVAGDLKISEIVDAPNWVVSMHFPKAIIEGEMG